MGRVRGHRGVRGELTVDVWRNAASFWKSVEQVWIEAADGTKGRFFEIETSRAYRDRLVLKLRGLDDPTRVAELRGYAVKVAESAAPQLPAGEHYVTRLVGLGVFDESDNRLGTVRDILPTAGVDVLVVEPCTHAGATDASHAEHAKQEVDEIMIPMARTIVLAISPEEGRIVVRPPAGLLELNRKGGA